MERKYHTEQFKLKDKAAYSNNPYHIEFEHSKSEIDSYQRKRKARTERRFCTLRWLPFLLHRVEKDSRGYNSKW